MTLVELLVVITILGILLGAAIPVLSPADDSRRLREAARAVNTFIAGAKSRAKETGRPFGVAFKKLSQDTGRSGPRDSSDSNYLKDLDNVANDNGVCLELYYVEEPPPYAGFDSNARVMLGTDAVGGGVFNAGQIMVRYVRVGNDVAQNNDGLPPGYDSDEIPTGLFRPGDQMVVGDMRLSLSDTASGGSELTNGFYTTGMGNPANSMFATPLDGSLTSVAYVYDSNGRRLNDTPQSAWFDGRFWTEPLRYKILRQPTKASGEPLLMNEKTAIDLEASGFGNGVRLHDPYQTDSSGDPYPRSNPNEVIVMFTPEGAMNEAYLNTGPGTAGVQRSLISSNLFVLVGLRENLPAPETDFYNFSGTDRDKQDEKAKLNWLNGDSRWVVVGAQTGAVATVENAFVNPQTYAGSALPPAGNMLDGSRSQALQGRRDAEVTAAREFARQAVSQGGR
ncbi:pilus assembly FimT family protein [Posidoniimonas polymericola]|nr:type II secretion system protein [Posidoniimonas polymericola]